MTKFNYVSLFSGIGGFEQALNKFGGTCVFASEIDKFAAQAYEALYGEEPAGDITKINAKDIPDHDLLVGGFPCQSFSVAGKREGFEDTRGTLFFEIARIAAEKKPKALLLENVKGLVNHDKGNTLDTMIRTLNDIGYVIDFDVLNSKYFNVPQNRERIFIVAIREDLIEQEEWLYTKGQTIVPRGKRRIAGYEWAKTFNFDFPNSETKYDHYTKSERDRIRAAERILADEEASEQRKENARKRIEELSEVVDKYEHLKPLVTTRLRVILEKEVDEKYYLDEEKTARLVAQLEEKDKTVGTVGHHPFSKKYEFKGYNSEITPSLIATDYKAPKTVLEGEPQMLGHVDLKGNDSIKRTYSTEGISPTLTTMGGGHREPKNAEEQEVRPKYRIRKLTPLECWRLQGFSDEAHEAVKAAGISDSQRYKQAGNAVTVNVIEAIGERLIPLIS